MTLYDLMDATQPARKRAPNGLPELTQTQMVRLTPQDLKNLGHVRRAIGYTGTDSGLIRAIIRCAVVDTLGAYDTVDVQRAYGVTVIDQHGGTHDV